MYVQRECVRVTSHSAAQFRYNATTYTYCDDHTRRSLSTPTRSRSRVAKPLSKTSLLRQNDVATSFSRNNYVIITSRARWDDCHGKSL